MEDIPVDTVGDITYSKEYLGSREVLEPGTYEYDYKITPHFDEVHGDAVLYEYTISGAQEYPECYWVKRAAVSGRFEYHSIVRTGPNGRHPNLLWLHIYLKFVYIPNGSHSVTVNVSVYPYSFVNKGCVATVDGSSSSTRLWREPDSPGDPFNMLASCPSGITFIGWYKDGVLYDTRNIFSMFPSDDVSLEARFVEGTGLPLHGSSGPILHSLDGRILCDA